jgi:transcriptional regulator with XRE-family HTH domain
MNILIYNVEMTKGGLIVAIFGERLKKLRAKKGITQEKLAVDLDIPESSIRRLEIADGGIPRMDRLKQIADYFNVSTDYLLGKDDPQVKENGFLSDEQVLQAAEIFSKLSKEEQSNLLNFMKGMAYKGK